MTRNLHIAHLPRLISERRSSAILGMVIIAMIWAGIFLKYFESVEADRRDAQRTNQNFAMLFEENVLRSIGEIDKALLYLRRSIEDRQGSTDFHTIVNTTDVLSEIIVQVAIIDANGIMRASNAGPQPAPPIDLSDREHYRVHVNSTADNLFISKPLIGRASKKWSVQFTRRFLHKDGTFAGVVVASLNPAHFTAFYDKIDLGSAASITLLGSDGVVRSTGGSAGDFKLGQDVSGTKLFGYIQAGQNATFEDTDRPDGDARLMTIRKVRGYPLWVTVSVSADAIFRTSWSNLQLFTAAGAALTLIILAALEHILRAEEKARQKAEQLQLTLEHMSQGIMLVTKDREIPIINKRCGELLGLPAEAIENPPRWDRLMAHVGFDARPASGARAPAERPDPEDALASHAPAVYERTMPNGTIIEIRREALPDGGFVQTVTDITTRRQAEAHVARLASEDPLTGLPNRRVFRAALERVSAAARGDAPHATFAVLFLDLDRFKLINDTLGHRIGDLFLQEIAQRLRKFLAPADLLARLGGDEFAVLVPSVQSRCAIEKLANALVETVVQPFQIDGHRLCSSVSIGIAIGPDDGCSADDLLMAADLALYAAKASGRGTFKFYHASMNKELDERRQIEMDLREAIKRNDLELHYQPIVSLRDHAVTGFEALARWRHPTRGLIPPAAFIALAEDNGLILLLGEWTLKEACRQAAQWPSDLRVAVNLSPVQFAMPDLVDMIERTLSETGLPPHRLELEITERMFLADGDHTLSILHRLKGLGVRIAMDDFGTGYSSLSYLRSFPFDKIKIDRAFVSDLVHGSEHLVIVQAVVSIARALGMTTTAEGVETAEQQQLLGALGCDEAQGYLFGRPVAADEVLATAAARGSARTVAA